MHLRHRFFEEILESIDSQVVRVLVSVVRIAVFIVSDVAQYFEDDP